LIMNANSRMIAFYLPQFHPIKENDEWWGKGFTEWTNTARARPMFPGHYQPHIPADLGFYDLRVPETRIAQATLAKESGIEGFCYYHYWFAGRRLIERPFDEVLRSSEPDFPFCLCWANESWTGIWHGNPSRVLVEQTYPGAHDYDSHFNYLLDVFADNRYIQVDGKPLFIIYKPASIPDSRRVMDHFRDMAHRAGLRGLYIVGISAAPWSPTEFGCDGMIVHNFWKIAESDSSITRIIKDKACEMLNLPRIYSYGRATDYLLTHEATEPDVYPSVVHAWDNTPRSGKNGWVLHGSNPDLFRKYLKATIKLVKTKQMEHRLIFLKSWNEWAEGNHLEPDLRHGKGYLDVIRQEVEGD
jgi:lipopolysaccharide biosynthesis protein